MTDMYIYGTKPGKGYMSNSYARDIVVDSITYKSVEHYFQTQKFNDGIERSLVINAYSPRVASRVGRMSGISIRNDWESVKDSIMSKAVVAKFTQHNDLRDKLTQTGNGNLVEKTTRDYYWGCGEDGSGENKFGKLLMSVRDA